LSIIIMNRGALAILIIFVLSPHLTLAADPKGFFDYAGCDVFSGWSCDADSYSTPLAIHFYADGTASTGSFVGSTVAGNAREAAVGTQCGGYVSHGFSFPTPASLKDGLTHTIYAYAINTPSGINPLLTNNGKTINCCAGDRMSIQFLGTGAADSSSWKSYGRQLSSILVNKDLLVDLSCWTNDAGGNKGTCGVARLQQYGIDMNAINYMLITHHHLDHFDPAQIVALAQARTSTTKLTLYGGVTVVSQMNSYLSSNGKTGLINVVHLEPYTSAAVGPYMVTPLIANHDTPDNEPYVYMIKYYGKQFMYGTDSGVLAGTSLSTIYSKIFDLVIRERTFASGSGVDHMDTSKVAAERADWIAHGVITASTPYYLTHIAYCGVGNCAIPSGTVDPGDGAKVYICLPPTTTTTTTSSTSTTTTTTTTRVNTTTSTTTTLTNMSTTTTTTSTTTTTAPTTTTTSTTSSSTTTSESSTTSTSTTTLSTSTSSTTTSTIANTTTSTTPNQCVMPGNYAPCGELSLFEAVEGIYSWVSGNLGLGELIDLIDSWADPADYPPG
jgi:hypothetical protein